ncbi:MAG: CRTAC1 family protein [Bryobacterales bacterium]|nr:CRTAC1 family protein [Bryobacterales bacterium]
MAGGVALLDYDSDGRLDIFLVNGGKLDDPARTPIDFRRADPAYASRLYRQQPNGAFTDVTAQAGLLRGVPNAYGMGAAVGDIDNDGDADLYVTGYGANVLYRNDAGVFTATAEAAANGWSVSAAFFDYDNDGRLDLFVARYLDWSFERNILCGTPFHAYCRPDKFNGVPNLLFHNEGGGRFRDVSQSSGIAAVPGKGMGAAVGDYDGDGFADVFVANDGMEQYLFHNNGNGTFTERALEAGVALSDDARTYAGMGAAFGDYDNDARPDLVVTNLALEKYALYRNEGGGRFSYATLATGLGAATARSSGWGVGLHDFDNDGHKDIFAAQSHVLDNVERIHTGLRYLEPPALYRNDGNRFTAMDLRLPAVAGRGAAFGDLNNDGKLDAVVSVLGAGPLILLNRAGAPGVTLRLEGMRANRDGAGAIVRAGSQTVTAGGAGSYLSASDIRVHLAGRPAMVEIVWPGGKRQVEKLAPGALATVKEKE